MHVLNGKTADEVWRAAAYMLTDPHLEFVEGRGGSTLEMLHVGFSMSEPRQRWVTSRVPVINPAFALAEVIWIMAGRKDAAFINFFNSKYPKFAGNGIDYYGAYGFRLRNSFGVDQLNRAYMALKDDPSTRQAVLQYWSPDDMPAAGMPSGPDVPCNVCSMLKVRDGKLEWMQVMRSTDVFLGLPYNIVQFTMLQEIMAGWLGLKLGTFSLISDSMHMYERDRGVMKVQINDRKKFDENTDQFVEPKGESEALWARLSEYATWLIEGDEIEEFDVFPEPYRNMITILGAEAARRRKDIDASDRIMTRCTNPVYVAMWTRWLARIHEERK